MIEREEVLPVTRQCTLLGISRSRAYYSGAEVSEAELTLMRLIDEGHLKYPFYGSRRIHDWLEDQGHRVNRKKVRRLMRTMGLVALYPKRRTSLPGRGHTIYPYRLKGLSIDRPNQVWAADICYLPMAKGFLYLVAIIDWYSRKVLAWRLSNTLDSHFCVEALEEALGRYGCPEIFNTDKGANSPARHSQERSRTLGSPSAWMGKDAGSITCSSNAFGVVSNTRRSISRPMKTYATLKQVSSSISVFTIPNAAIRHLADKPPMPSISVDGTCQKRHDEQ